MDPFIRGLLHVDFRANRDAVSDFNIHKLETIRISKTSNTTGLKTTESKY